MIVDAIHDLKLRDHEASGNLDVFSRKKESGGKWSDLSSGLHGALFWK
jgi:hypothetical protein